MKTKWKDFMEAQGDKEYLALASSITLKSYWHTPKFMRFGMAIQKQLANTGGLVGYLMVMEPFSKKYGTLSVWESEEALMKFTKELPHCRAMEEMRPCIDGKALYVRWQVRASEIPPAWEKALEILSKG